MRLLKDPLVVQSIHYIACLALELNKTRQPYLCSKHRGIDRSEPLSCKIRLWSTLLELWLM